MSLGDQVRQVAGEEVGGKLSRLGVPLGSEGGALTGTMTKG